MENLKISIVVWPKNCDRTIISCVESIVFQTYKNLEIVLIYDLDTSDSIKDKCEQLAIKYNRIKILTYDKDEMLNLEELGERVLFIEGNQILTTNAVAVMLGSMSVFQTNISAGTLVKKEKKSAMQVNTVNITLKLEGEEVSYKNIIFLWDTKYLLKKIQGKKITLETVEQERVCDNTKISLITTPLCFC